MLIKEISQLYERVPEHTLTQQQQQDITTDHLFMLSKMIIEGNWNIQ